MNTQIPSQVASVTSTRTSAHQETPELTSAEKLSAAFFEMTGCNLPESGRFVITIGAGHITEFSDAQSSELIELENLRMYIREAKASLDAFYLSVLGRESLDLDDMPPSSSGSPADWIDYHE